MGSFHRILALRRFLSILAAGSLPLAGCADTETRAEPIASAASHQVAEVMASNGETLVYESIRHTPPPTETADGSIIEPEPVFVSEVGEMSAELYQRYARPFAYASEAEHHHFAAWQVPLEDGTVEHGIRITRTSTGPAVDQRTSPKTWIEPSLDISPIDPDAAAEMQTVLVRIRDYPDWDIPLLPDAAMLDVQSYAHALEAREKAIAAREALLQTRAAELEAHIEAGGGLVTQWMWYIGWIEATVPQGLLASLAVHPDVQTITPAHMPGGTGAGRTDWRPVEAMGVQPYWDAGQVGDEPNPNRHAHGAITIGTVDAGPVKDEAAAFCTDGTCTTTKFAKRYRCDLGGFWGCGVVFDYLPSLENQNIEATNHATTVAAEAVADYLDGQGALVGLSGNGPDAATSDARDAKLIHYGPLGGFNEFPGKQGTSYTNALFWNIVEHVDVTTSGTYIFEASPGGDPCEFPSQCSLDATLAHEHVAENAFDDGVFLAILPSNSCGPSQSTCTVASPAHVPKVFTVNGLRPYGNGCENDYRLCNLDTTQSSRGGASAMIGSVTYPNAVSVIDLAVPQGLSYYTRCGPDTGSSCLNRGEVVTAGDTARGTSFANPRLAGLAAVAKDYFLDTNQSWFNDPGWLHVYMLGQGDSHRSLIPSDVGVDTYRAQNYSDKFYGLGRVKMRHPDQFGMYAQDFRSHTFTILTAYDHFIGNAPLPASTQALKCVTAQHEDMSHKDDIGRVKLEIRLRPPLGGLCSTVFSPVAYRADSTGYDTKHMVAFHGSEQQLGGYCAHVRVTPQVLPSSGSVWAQTFCYAADEEEDAPN